MGHVISGQGISVDPAKVEAVKEWPQPTTASEIRSFLDLAGYYHKFVEKFWGIAALLTQLTWKGTKFVWDESYEKAFQELKCRLTETLILAIPEGSEGYEVYTCASEIGWGAY